MRYMLLTFILSTLFLSSFVSAAETVEELISELDSFVILISAFLVFFMHAGFAMLETGFTRAKNALNILLKNFFSMSVGVIVYFALGFSLMYGASYAGFVGFNGFFLIGDYDSIGGFLFDAVFAATAATVISGAVAERIKLGSYIAIVVFMTAIVYPVAGHWIWSDDGWLSALGFSDYAGSTLVHSVGAWGAIVAVYFLGARLGKYDKGVVNTIHGHNLPLGALGVFILWFGWFGFNTGSALAFSIDEMIHVAVTTLLAACAGVIGASIMSVIKFKKVDASLTFNGALAGLVGITAGPDVISPLGALAVGFIAGIILVQAIQIIDQNLRLDDPVGAIAVHGICGAWGTLAVGLFSVDSGLFYGGGAGQLMAQAIGIVSVFVWVVVAMGIFMFILTKVTSIRVPAEEEVQGLDFAEHGSSAYSTGLSSLGLGLADRLNIISKNGKTTSL
ncbi:ammonium transporter [Desulfuribacillus stibiiarsenatis]|uniref:Ammonium transporter n=2 Tax=Desulfuribacillus stibiiarsenatis TaxID=1390249 RepID=A0A1E5L960_9FIRM|nr:ammonium transporter [Desulfuribacillus stibiiarsenatis]